MYDCIAIHDQSYCIGIAEENIAIYCNTNILLHPYNMAVSVVKCAYVMGGMFSW